MFGTVLQKLLRLEKFVLLAGRLFHILITRLLKKVCMTELEHRCLFSVYGCPCSCDWALETKKASLASHSRPKPKTILYTKIKSARIRLSFKLSKQSTLSRA